MGYPNWGDGEPGAPAPRAADPAYPVHERRPVDPPAGGGPRVPGQRSPGYDEELPRPYVSEGEPGWNGPPTSSGRHRRPDHTGKTAPDVRSGVPDAWHAERRWRPTLDPTDWRYATDDVGYPYGPAEWEGNRSAPDQDRSGGQHPDRYDAGRHDAAEGNAPDPRRRPADDATEVFGAIRDDHDPRGNAQGRRRTEREPWSPDVTGHWELPSDTGQWEQFTDTDEWLGDQSTGTQPAGPAAPVDPPYRQDGFWSGIRLAGDDPRWTGTPSSAPHSPAVSLPDEAASPPAGPSAAAPLSGDPEPEHGESRGAHGVVAALLCTVAWYVVPALVLLAWILTLDGSPPQDCVVGAGQHCVSARAQAAAAVVDAGPRAAVALGASLAVAVLLRWASSWRTASVGLAAAVIGGGLSTLLTSVISGQPLG